MKAFRKRVKKESLYKEYVRVLNGLLQLSDREAEVFALLLQLDTEWKPVWKENKDILSTDMRKALMQKTLINKNNLTKYLTTLKEKGVLIMTYDGGWEVHPTFVPDIVGDLTEIVFVLDSKK